MSQETKVSLKVQSLMQTPEAISELVGLACDHGWHVGERRKIGPSDGDTVCVKFHTWIVQSWLPESASLDEHMRGLMMRLEPYALKLRALSELPTVSLECSCVVFSGTIPALNVDRSVIGKLAVMGASLDIDLYIFSDDD